jgi:hypothetical protein
MSWSLQFDDPIELAKGNSLRDAAEHVTALPRAVAELEHWQTAIACLIAAAEKRGIVMMARIANDAGAANWKAASSAGAAAEGDKEIPDRQLARD